MDKPVMRHVFGPVPSRRLGMSLGVDPIPLKTCNFSCVYCQLGRTRRPAQRRNASVKLSDVVVEVASVLASKAGGAIDWITFVGGGETTLSSRLGPMIRFVKSLTDIPVAVITNGSLLHVPSVKADLAAADAVLPSLDAGTAELYQRINRPLRELSFDRHVAGLVGFRRVFSGKLWVEVMLLAGINDTEKALRDLATVLQRVEPDEIHLATPTRPPAEPSVEPPGPEGLERAAAILGRVAKVLQPVPVDGTAVVDGNLAGSVLTILRRHPLQEAEVESFLTRSVRVRVEEEMEAIRASGAIQVVERFGKRFWCSRELDFPGGVESGSRPPTALGAA